MSLQQRMHSRAKRLANRTFIKQQKKMRRKRGTLQQRMKSQSRKIVRTGKKRQTKKGSLQKRMHARSKRLANKVVYGGLEQLSRILRGKTKRKRKDKIPKQDFPRKRRSNRNLLMRIKIRDEAKFFFALSQGQGILNPVIWEQIRLSMYDLSMDIRKYATRLIKIKAPKETGKLRESLIESLYIDDYKKILRAKKIDDFQIEIRMYSNISYADAVNNMETLYGEKHVRHFGERIGKRSNRPLWDPFAIKDFYSIIIREVRKHTRTHFLPIFYKRLSEVIDNPKKYFSVTR